MWRRHRSTVVAIAGLVTIGAVLLVGRPADGQSDGDATGNDGEQAPTATAEVTRRDLVEREELDGTLGYGDGRSVSVARQGTVTDLPAKGSVVDRGQVLAEIDGRPSILLFGERPAWRTLDESVSAGPDVAQLEENLIAMGFGNAASLGPNERWSQATTAAVKRWQESLGLEETGVVEMGDAVFLPGPVRVADHLAGEGDGAGGPVLSVSDTSRTVVVALAADRQGLLTVGQAVEIELPDGTVTTGTVTSVSTVVTPPADANSDPTVAVTISLDDPAASGVLDQAPVAVRVTTTEAAGVSSVPVEALLVLAEGGYAIERVAGDGTTELVAVETGAFADGFVEITGDVAEGDEVVVPE